jgi:hypothetical protein
MANVCYWFYSKISFYFDFVGANVGVGMLCTYNTCISILIATIFCSGIVLPYLRRKAGVWYDETLLPEDYRGMYGYQVRNVIIPYISRSPQKPPFFNHACICVRRTSVVWQ